MESIEQLAAARLGSVHDAYDDFVIAVVSGAKKRGMLEDIIVLIDENPDIGTSDVIAFLFKDELPRGPKTPKERSLGSSIPKSFLM